uniref:Mitochondrial import inner membrane translocase subunit TIM44 n=2 Tax=Eptatretus burgeri TaxID=7764 RepID=A0A8C4Q126_EPTBU
MAAFSFTMRATHCGRQVIRPAVHLVPRLTWRSPRVYTAPMLCLQLRWYTSPGRKGFLSDFIDNIKQDLNKSKEMKENVKKFREEARKLEESDALQQARRKFKSIESETIRSSETLRKKLEELTETVKEGIEEVGKSDIGQRVREGVEEAARSARGTAESFSKSGEKLGKTTAFQVFSQVCSAMLIKLYRSLKCMICSLIIQHFHKLVHYLCSLINFRVRAIQSVETVRREIDDTVLGQIGSYKPPAVLRKRSDLSFDKTLQDKVFAPNEEATGMMLHKDSRWYQQWKDFRDSNVVIGRFFEMKMRYDESDNALVRASRAVTEKVSDLMGGLFSKTEMSEVLTEILKADRSFDKDAFLQQCQHDIIPNILEAMMRGDLDVLKDWCYEATFSQLAHPIKQAKALGYTFHSRVLDVDNVDLAMGKLMEQGPVLIITFQAQLVLILRNSKGDVVEGHPEQVVRMMYVWALCRDQEELNPKAAWRLLDMSASSTQQVL